jgi:hypothetical protein
MENGEQAVQGGGQEMSDAQAVATLTEQLGSLGAETETTGDAGGDAGVVVQDGAETQGAEQTEAGEASAPVDLSREDVQGALLSYLIANGMTGQQAAQAVQQNAQTAGTQDSQQGKPAAAEPDEIDKLLEQFDPDDNVRLAVGGLKQQNQTLQRRLEALEQANAKAEQARQEAERAAQQQRVQSEWLGIADELRGRGYEHVLGPKGKPLTDGAKAQLLGYAATVQGLKMSHPHLTEQQVREQAVKMLPPPPKKAATPPGVRRPGSAVNGVAPKPPAAGFKSDQDAIAYLGKLLGG